jgi:hypothetical protein
MCGDVNNLEPLKFQGEPIDIGRADLVLNPSSIPVSGSVDRAGTAVIVQPGYQRMSNFDRMLNTNYKVIPLDKVTGKDGQILAGGSFVCQIYSKAIEMTKAMYDGAFGPKAGSSSLFTVKETPGLKLISTPGPIKLPINPKDFAEFLEDPGKYINKDPRSPARVAKILRCLAPRPRNNAESARDRRERGSGGNERRENAASVKARPFVPSQPWWRTSRASLACRPRSPRY